VPIVFEQAMRMRKLTDEAFHGPRATNAERVCAEIMLNQEPRAPSDST
jgi:hypothetical protein